MDIPSCTSGKMKRPFARQKPVGTEERKITAVAGAVCAKAGEAIAADTAAPKRSRADFSLEMGFVLPLLILIVTCVWGVWAIVQAHDERVDGSASLAPAVRADGE